MSERGLSIGMINEQCGLDETLVHATTRLPANRVCDMVIRVSVEGVSCVFYVSKRPHVEHFIRTVAQWYELIVFTASLSQYADPVINTLDPFGHIGRRYFRDSCLHRGGAYIKNLQVVCADLSQIVIVDNSPAAYSINRENAIPISDWLGDNHKHDEALLALLPFLSALRHLSDVRSILSLRLKPTTTTTPATTATTTTTSASAPAAPSSALSPPPS